MSISPRDNPAPNPSEGWAVLTRYPNLSNVLLVREKHERGTGFKKLSDKLLTGHRQQGNVLLIGGTASTKRKR